MLADGVSAIIKNCPSFAVGRIDPPLISKTHYI